MKSFKQLLHERVSQDLYHSTEFHKAVYLLQDGYFLLSEAHGDDIQHSYGFKYFLSTARTLKSDFIINTIGSGQSVIFALDGDKLSHNFRIDAVDWFQTPEKQGRFRAVGKTETEDRILTNKNRISLKPYCKEIYCLLNREYLVSEADEVRFRQLAPTYAPTWIFGSGQNILNKNKSKAEKL